MPFRVIVCVCALCAGLFAVSRFSLSAGNSATETAQREQDTTLRRKRLRALTNHLEFARICDTVYVVGNRYLEVNLRTQYVTLRFRNGDSLRIPISTGNATITDAIATPTGIFSIQSKTPEALSRQFDNTKMLWWIGFNYNVGFHGLEKNSYYKYLGVRPSSHGCVRTGREDVKKLYDMVDLGDPVIVYDTIPARILAFADTTRTHFDTTSAFRLGSRTKARAKLMNERLELLYAGKRLAEQQFSLYIPRHYQLRPGGYRVGSRDSLIAPQEYPSTIAAGFTRSPRDVFADNLDHAWFAKERALFKKPLSSPTADSVSSVSSETDQKRVKSTSTKKPRTKKIIQEPS